MPATKWKGAGPLQTDASSGTSGWAALAGHLVSLAQMHRLVMVICFAEGADLLRKIKRRVTSKQ